MKAVSIAFIFASANAAQITVESGGSIVLEHGGASAGSDCCASLKERVSDLEARNAALESTLSGLTAQMQNLREVALLIKQPGPASYYTSRL